MTIRTEADWRSHLAIWWKQQRSGKGFLRAIAAFGKLLWEFAVDSLPERRRRRYGDADYDWDHRVNTTSGTLTRRERFLGLLHSPYQPTDPAIFQQIMETLTRSTPIRLEEFTFIDVGSGKGRTLLMASDYPFRRILGIELIPSLHQSAETNIAAYKNTEQKCFALQSICADAVDFDFPDEPLVLYLFNPLPEAGLVQMLAKMQASLRQFPREVLLVYHNPLFEARLAKLPSLKKIAGNQQFAIFRFQREATVPDEVARME